MAFPLTIKSNNPIELLQQISENTSELLKTENNIRSEISYIDIPDYSNSFTILILLFLYFLLFHKKDDLKVKLNLFIFLVTYFVIKYLLVFIGESFLELRIWNEDIYTISSYMLTCLSYGNFNFMTKNKIKTFFTILSFITTWIFSNIVIFEIIDIIKLRLKDISIFFIAAIIATIFSTFFFKKYNNILKLTVILLTLISLAWIISNK